MGRDGRRVFGRGGVEFGDEDRLVPDARLIVRPGDPVDRPLALPAEPAGRREVHLEAVRSDTGVILVGTRIDVTAEPNGFPPGRTYIGARRPP